MGAGGQIVLFSPSDNGPDFFGRVLTGPSGAHLRNVIECGGALTVLNRQAVDNRHPRQLENLRFDFSGVQAGGRGRNDQISPVREAEIPAHGLGDDSRNLHFLLGKHFLDIRLGGQSHARIPHQILQSGIVWVDFPAIEACDQFPATVALFFGP